MSNLEEVLQILNPMTSTIFWSIVVFVILVIVLWKFVLKPVNNMISKRQEEIREKIDTADRKSLEANEYLEEQKKTIDRSRVEAKKIIDEGKEAARKIKEEIENQASEKSKLMLENALIEIRSEKDRSINEVKDEMVDIALSASQKMISKSLSEEDHKKLIEESLKDLGKV
ncbi:MAG: F0F1 ATP synthase subunit B [Actinobacteria bacterium]|nr:F0F1 ATP synthase subunit B [Actinomycetota bacterium]